MSTQGHNNPPSPVETYADKVKAYGNTAAALGPVTEENAKRYRDEIGYGSSLAKEIDGQRDSEKRPHLEAGRKIDADYKPLVEGAEAVQKGLKKKLQDFVVAKEREAKRIADEAARKAREAEEAARQAEAANDDDPFLAATAAPAPDPVAAQAEAKVAALEVKAAARVGSETGGFVTTALKTVRKAKINDYVALATHYLAKGDFDLKALLEKLANADIRHAKGAAITLPGVEIVEERVL